MISQQETRDLMIDAVESIPNWALLTGLGEDFTWVRFREYATGKEFTITQQQLSKVELEAIPENADAFIQIATFGKVVYMNKEMGR